MSTILKALRRLEKDKTRTDRPLREQVTGLGGADDPEGGATRRWPILVGGIGTGVAAGVAVLLMVFSRGDSDAPPPAEAPGPQASAAQPAPAGADASRQRRQRRQAQQAPRPGPAGPSRGVIQPIPPGQAPSANPAVPFVPADPAAEAPAPLPTVASDDVEVIDRGVPGPRLAPEGAEAAPIAPAETTPGSARPFQRAQRAAAPSAPREVDPARVEAQPIAAELAAAEAPPSAAEPAPAAEPAAAAPVVAKAPSRPPPPSPDPFPSLRVERTTWHPLAERRLAVVDVPGEGARELREGDAVAGATVARIEPSGVVFRFAGRDVRRPVGAAPRRD